MTIRAYVSPRRAPRQRKRQDARRGSAVGQAPADAGPRRLLERLARGRLVFDVRGEGGPLEGPRPLVAQCGARLAEAEPADSGGACAVSARGAASPRGRGGTISLRDARRGSHRASARRRGLPQLSWPSAPQTNSRARGPCFSPRSAWRRRSRCRAARGSMGVVLACVAPEGLLRRDLRRSGGCPVKRCPHLGDYLAKSDLSSPETSSIWAGPVTGVGLSLE